MLKNTIFLIVLITACGLSNADYCNIETCELPGPDIRPHTLCMYQSEEPAPACNEVIKVGLTAEEKQKIVNLHNELRQKVANGEEKRGDPGPQPPAANMQQMEWDDEIADVAQRWANQCNYVHDKCRDVERFQVGQNLHIRPAYGDMDVNDINVEDLVREWYDEVKLYNANNVTSFSDLKAPNGDWVGHYTQFVWADTNKVGCGAVKYFNEFKDYGKTKWLYLVCNYGPTGNWLEQPLYRIQN